MTGEGNLRTLVKGYFKTSTHHVRILAEILRIPMVLYLYAVTSDQWGPNRTALEKGVDAVLTSKQHARILSLTFSFH